MCLNTKANITGEERVREKQKRSEKKRHNTAQAAFKQFYTKGMLAWPTKLCLE